MAFGETAGGRTASRTTPAARVPDHLERTAGPPGRTPGPGRDASGSGVPRAHRTTHGAGSRTFAACVVGCRQASTSTVWAVCLKAEIWESATSWSRARRASTEATIVAGVFMGSFPFAAEQPDHGT